MKNATWTKTLGLLGGGALACMLLACQARETVIVREAGAAKPSDGTMDGGGANGVGGKHLEHWAVVITNRQEYKEIVKPLVENLSKCFMPLAADMEYLASNARTWYMVPVELSQLPAVRIGTPFATTQFAIQNYFDIWINSKLYDPLSLDERAEIVVHELMVGVRLLKDSYPVERCLASITLREMQGKSKQSELEEARNKCREMYPRILTPPKIDFGSETISQIRNLTLDLIRSKGGLDRAHLRCGELKSRLKSAGLRDYDMI